MTMNGSGDTSGTDSSATAHRKHGDRGERAGFAALGLTGSVVAVAGLMLWASWSTLAVGGGVQARDFGLDVTPETVRICAPAPAHYAVGVGSIQGFSDPVTLSAIGTPAGTTVSFTTNPVTPPGNSQMSILDTGSATAGVYEIQVVGVAPTSTHTDTAFLRLFNQPPGAAVLLLPPNGSTDQLRVPRFQWAEATQTDTYELQLALDAGFSSTFYTATLETTVHMPGLAIDPATEVFWRVRTHNPCGDGFSEIFSLTTGTTKSVLLVDDDDDSPDVAGVYGDALTTLGMPFDRFDTLNSDDEPGPALLDLYEIIIWYSGAEFGVIAGAGVAGPGPLGEDALAIFLGGGGCLLLSSQDYLWDHGLTPFGTTYLGISSYTSDVSQTVVWGQGELFSGLGPYTLDFPFANYSDQVTPGSGAEVAFSGDLGDAAVTLAADGYRTFFFGFPLEAIQSPADRAEVLAAALMGCPLIFVDGFESGNLSHWPNSNP